MDEKEAEARPIMGTIFLVIGNRMLSSAIRDNCARSGFQVIALNTPAILAVLRAMYPQNCTKNHVIPY